MYKDLEDFAMTWQEAEVKTLQELRFVRVVLPDVLQATERGPKVKYFKKCVLLML